MYLEKERYENLQHGIFEGVGKYDIPQLIGSSRNTVPELIGFNYAKTAKDKQAKGVHFFLDDYQFTRLWNRPLFYLDLLKEFNVVLSPDFSLYSDFPLAMQIYNHYRKHWLAALWEHNGIEVIPTICWSDKRSFDWCFDGEPKESTVAVSAIGTQKSREAKEAFLLGFNEMKSRLNPKSIVFYGNIPSECAGDNVIPVRSFQDELRKRVK